MDVGIEDKIESRENAYIVLWSSFHLLINLPFQYSISIIFYAGFYVHFLVFHRCTPLLQL